MAEIDLGPAERLGDGQRAGADLDSLGSEGEARRGRRQRLDPLFLVPDDLLRRAERRPGRRRAAVDRSGRGALGVAPDGQLRRRALRAALRVSHRETGAEGLAIVAATAVDVAPVEGVAGAEGLGVGRDVHCLLTLGGAPAAIDVGVLADQHVVVRRHALAALDEVARRGRIERRAEIDHVHGDVPCGRQILALAGHAPAADLEAQVRPPQRRRVDACWRHRGGAAGEGHGGARELAHVAHAGARRRQDAVLNDVAQVEGLHVESGEIDVESEGRDRPVGPQGDAHQVRVGIDVGDRH